MIKIINFCHTRPSSSSSPHYLSFFFAFYPPVSYLFTLPCSLSHFFILFLHLHFITIILFFTCSFISSSYHPFSPCAHNHSSPPSSYFPTHISLSYYHAPFPRTQFFLLSSSWNIYRLFLLHPSPSALINVSSFPPPVTIPATYRYSRLPNVYNNKSVTALSFCRMQAFYLKHEVNETV